VQETKDTTLKVIYRRNEESGIDIWVYRGSKHVATFQVDQDNNARSYEVRKK
jgi:hypothetical protein